MNHVLSDTLNARATRGAEEHGRIDTDALLDDVRRDARQLVRRRRNLAAAGGGSLLVVALAGALLAGGALSDDPAAPSSGPAPVAPAGPAPVATLGLEPVAPAPRTAEVSLGLVPTGWVLLSHQGPVTLYGPPRLRGSSTASFEHKLMVSVHERIGGPGTYPLTIAGRPASYSPGDGRYLPQGVDVVVDTTTEVNIQLPPEARLSRAAVLRLADTLDIRSTTEKTHG